MHVTLNIKCTGAQAMQACSQYFLIMKKVKVVNAFIKC